MAVQVTLSDLRAKVHEGWKKDQLAEYYGLPKAQVGKLLKDAGLTIRKFHAPKYELIDDAVMESSGDINAGYAVQADAVQSFEEEATYSSNISEQPTEQVAPDSLALLDVISSLEEQTPLTSQVEVEALENTETTQW